MSEDLATSACPHCGADNRTGELYCGRCGRRLPRSSAELREEMQRRLEVQRQSRRRLHLAIAIAIGLLMGIGIRILADSTPQDIVGMGTVVELARLFWWLAGAIWGYFIWLALRSGST